jgi:E3 ubiquitin-protein ligase synoviolin
MIRERLSSAVMESLLALTIFREEFSGFFIAMFATLVFIKVLHWLVQDRVDYVEVTPSVSVWQHVRIVAFMALLLFIDSCFLQCTISGTIQSSGQSVMLLFAFEYVIQASTVVRYILKYAMSVVDLALDGRWEAKSTYVFYLELISDLLHLFVYVSFFMIVFMNYGLPLHLVGVCAMPVGHCVCGGVCGHSGRRGAECACGALTSLCDARGTGIPEM